MCCASVFTCNAMASSRRPSWLARRTNPMRSRVYPTEAIVLRRSDFSEADRLLTLYTPRYGKRRVIAKGVRKTTSRLAGHIELFTRVQLLLAEGRNLDIVTQAQSIDGYRAFRE